jgi:hypothetical protein
MMLQFKSWPLQRTLVPGERPCLPSWSQPHGCNIASTLAGTCLCVQRAGMPVSCADATARPVIGVRSIQFPFWGYVIWELVLSMRQYWTCCLVYDIHLSCSSTPTLVDALWCAGIVSIDAGDYHSAAAAADGRLWTWGRGKHGALGHGDNDNRIEPTLVEGLLGTPVVAVAAGGTHTVALSQRRHVYTWGHNRVGQLGLGHRNDGVTPVVIANSESWRIVQVRTTPSLAHTVHSLTHEGS